MLPPRKPLASDDLSLDEELPKPNINATPKRKLMPSFEDRSSMPCAIRNRFFSSDLPSLEEERDTDVDTFSKFEIVLYKMLTQTVTQLSLCYAM